MLLMLIYFARLFQILQHFSKCRSKGKFPKLYFSLLTLSCCRFTAFCQVILFSLNIDRVSRLWEWVRWYRPVSYSTSKRWFSVLRVTWDVGFKCRERVPPKYMGFALASTMSQSGCDFKLLRQESTGDIIISGSCETSSFAATWIRRLRGTSGESVTKIREKTAVAVEW